MVIALGSPALRALGRQIECGLVQAALIGAVDQIDIGIVRAAVVPVSPSRSARRWPQVVVVRRQAFWRLGLAFGFAAGLLAVCGRLRGRRRQRDLRRSACRQHQQSWRAARIGRRIFISAAIPARLWLFRNGRMRLPDRLPGLRQRRRRAARIGPDEIADQNEIRARTRRIRSPLRASPQSRRKAARTVRPTIAGARRSPRPTAAARARRARRTARSPRPFRRRPSNRAVSSRPADAGDAVGFQRRQRILQGFDAGQMRAVGAGARDQFDMTVEQQRRAVVLDRGRQRLDAWRSWCAGPSSSAAPVPPRHRLRQAIAAKARQQGLRIVHDGRREIETRHAGAAGQVLRPSLCRLLFQIGRPTRPCSPAHSCARGGQRPAGPAATFSALPDHAFCGAACSARP